MNYTLPLYCHYVWFPYLPAQLRSPKETITVWITNHSEIRGHPAAAYEYVQVLKKLLSALVLKNKVVLCGPGSQTSYVKPLLLGFITMATVRLQTVAVTLLFLCIAFDTNWTFASVSKFRSRTSSMCHHIRGTLVSVSGGRTIEESVRATNVFLFSLNSQFLSCCRTGTKYEPVFDPGCTDAANACAQWLGEVVQTSLGYWRSRHDSMRKGGGVTSLSRSS